ncbi:MAG TPA: hypothetical protein VFQ77_02275 [Pseudonocardiaceae bacterium]|nr:hypothetical protein [Pseudonocardiaceae bacterium]
MSRSSEPERAQHSVAELLARYGEPAPSTGRRRRRAPDDTHTAPQSIIERVRTDSVPLPVVDSPERPAGHGLHERGAAFDNGWLDHPPATDLSGRSWEALDGGPPGPAAFDSPFESPPQPDLGGHSYQDTWMGLPPLGAEPAPFNDSVLSSGPITDQLPRLDPPHNGERPAGLDPIVRPVPEPSYPDWRPDDLAEHQPDRMHSQPDRMHSQPDRMQSQPGPAGSPLAMVAEPAAADPAPELAGDLGAEEPAEFAPSPVREWVVMATQISVGVLGGAVLWLISEWLWQRIPVLALVVALAVITGLVWVVRRVRRAEDLQTTVIAVLVGLFVTVSPAALLLVGR